MTVTEAPRYRRALTYLRERILLWGPPVFVGVFLGLDISAGRIHDIVIDAAILAACLFLSARSWLRLYRAGTTQARRDLIVALRRITDGNVWLARDDHKALCAQRKFGVLRLTRMDEDEVQHMPSGTPVPVVATRYIILKWDAKILRQVDGMVVSVDEADRETVTVHKQKKTNPVRYARETWQLFRMMGTGVMDADAEEIAELVRLVRVAERIAPDGAL